MSRKPLIRTLILLAGLGITFVSVFAFQLGLDNDPGWGAGRFRILIVGLLVVLFGAAHWFMPALNRFPLIARFSALFEAEDGAAPVPSKAHTLFEDALLVLFGVAVIWLYIWVISIGRIEKWPSGRDYYGLLAQAFQQGQTHLLVEPSPELLNLEDPYDFEQRKGLDYLWDVSLYDGKYYLYWGPVPAVAGAVFSSIASKPVTDAGLVFAFVSGSALFSALLLRALKKEYGYPGWLFWSGVSVLLVNIPLIWLLTRPKYYEVSAAGGQFFMLAGFYFLFLAFRSSPHSLSLALAALSFGLAGGSRINLLPSVIFLAAFMLWRLYLTRGETLKSLLPALAAVVLPLAIVAVGLAWYNYARFGSILEFGHRYQLTGAALTVAFNKTMSLEYLPPNLFNYVFRLPDFSAEFPFVTLGWIRAGMWPSFIVPPEGYYYTDPVGGLPILVPLIGLTLLLGLRILWLNLNGDVKLRASDSSGWFASALLGYGVIQAGVLLLFLTSALRYLADIAPQAILLSVVFAASYKRTFAVNSFQRRLLAALWIFASVLTVVFGLLISITGERNNFLNQNPQVYYQLLEWFTR